MNSPSQNDHGIAIVGMAGRFPKARNIDEFWRNLCNGVEGVTFFSDEELEAAGCVVPKGQPNYVKARAILDDADQFDAAFFGITPREAETIDPQHRIFLECAWEALEHAGCDPEKYDGAIGVFAGMGMNTYLLHNLAAHPQLLAQIGDYQAMLGNDKDFLPTRVSYKLNLRGPSLNIQTACSTSLVAVCVACQNLLNYDCDAALAGAVAINFPQKRGYLYQEGAISSPDGHCRPFDARAAGTVAGEGVGIVVLKRLEDAVANKDTIYGVIKGFAVNNDGSMKIGYAAPSVEGQSEVIVTAQSMAGFSPETISYIETHGTGTPLGDPIEIEGLTQAFRVGTTANQFCAIGSVKSNIGHLDTAAGVTGLIKTALAMHHKRIPPSLHYSAPNPKIDFENSPFYVNTQLVEWKADKTPRRAGVSSLGIGGTNAHVVLEEAPLITANSESARPAHLLVLSGRTESALVKAAANLARHLRENPAIDLGHVAHTLQTGRREFSYRRSFVAATVPQAIEVLEKLGVAPARKAETETPAIAFMFSGQGSQHVNMARGLYDHETLFRSQVDYCCEQLKSHLGLDLRAILFSDSNDAVDESPLTQTCLAQPALFTIEYSLAKLWISWGIKPTALIGHSLGEYVAACLAGVLSLDAALALVAARGRLMQSMPAGRMLAVRLSEAELRPILTAELSLATINSPQLCVVSGAIEVVAAFQRALEARGVATTPLQTSHAFHSEMMEPMVGTFAELVRRIELRVPEIPFVSNVTGTWIKPEEATDPNYWARHLRQAVRFSDGVETLLAVAPVLIEIGPGQVLAGLARQHSRRPVPPLILPSLPRPKDETSDYQVLLTALGQMWTTGVEVNWNQFSEQQDVRRVPLPAYPFERKRYFIDPPSRRDTAAASVSIVPESVADTPETEPKVNETHAKSELEPGTSIEVKLRKMLGELSGLDLTTVESSTTFAELSFDSLFLTQAALAIEKQFKVRVAFRQLLKELSTLAALSAHIEKSAEASSVSEGSEKLRETEVKSEPPKSDEPLRLPLTEAQQELWLTSQVSQAASCSYNEIRLLHLRGPLRPENLQSAVRQLVTRHESLRTTFSPRGEAQFVHATMPVEVPLRNFAALDELGRQIEFGALQSTEAGQPFDLETGPLVRAQLVRLAPEHHVLVMTVHHIVCDGFSFGILLRELGELYSAECEGRAVALDTPLQMSEFVRAQSVISASAESDDFWLQQFSDSVPILELPADKPYPIERTFGGGRETIFLEAPIVESLKRLSAQNGCTLFSTLLAAYFVWLKRLTGHDDIVVGIPAADRAQDRANTLVGHCVNFLPVRGKIAGNPSFANFIGTVNNVFLDANEHQRGAFGRLIRKLNLPRDQNRMPLASVTFNLDRIRQQPAFKGLDVEVDLSPEAAMVFDLVFNVAEIGNRFRIDCRFNGDILQPETVRRWLSHFETLLESISAEANQSIGQLPLLSLQDCEQVLVNWNNTRAEYPRGTCVHHLFEDQVRRTPDSIAAIFGTHQLTYTELNLRADILARYLSGLGVGPDVPVAICVDRSMEMLVGVLGVLKAGGAYVPLDPVYPRERLGLMLENAKVPVLVTQKSLRDQFAATAQSCQLVCLDEPLAQSVGQPIPASNLSGENLAYVIHTSGSTGVPKGVAMPHRALVNLIAWQLKNSKLGNGARTLQFTSLSFDVSFQEIFSTWCSGGTLVMIDAELRCDMPGLLRFIGEESIERIFLPFVALQQLAEAAAEQSLPNQLREVVTAGEQLQITPAVVRWFESMENCTLHNHYGPSESHVVTAYTLSGPPSQWPKLPPIGRPIANTIIYLLDPAFRQPVPVGVPGELFIGGDCLARGYLNRPDLTDEKFIPNPLSGEPGARLYRTGDLARWLPDGNIEFLGRADHQVKIRGYRIELGDVEATIAQHPDVRECVVTVREDVPGDKRLVGYIVPVEPECVLTAGELKRFMADKLPDYMIPASVMVLEALPLTPSGKVNRRALPAPDPSQRDSAEAFIPPSTATEELIAEIWAKLLRLEKIGVRDNFFELGGHSLLLMQMVSRVGEAFQVELPIRCAFESPTIEGLSTEVENLLIKEIRALQSFQAATAGAA